MITILKELCKLCSKNERWDFFDIYYIKTVLVADFSETNKRWGSIKACSWENFLKKSKKNFTIIRYFRVGKVLNTLDKTAFMIVLLCDNYLPQWWVELDDELSWLFTNRLRVTRQMKIKRMGLTEILRRIWLFFENKIKSSELFCKPTNSTHRWTQLIIVAHNCHTYHFRCWWNNFLHYIITLLN